MTNCLETIQCGPSATGDDILSGEISGKRTQKLIKISELLESDSLTEIRNRIFEQREQALEETSTYEATVKIREVSYSELDSKLISDIRNSFNLKFFVGCWNAIKINFSFKLLISFIIGILGGFDVFLKSYFIIAGVSVLFGIWADIRNKRLTFSGLVKKITFQLALLGFIAVGNALTNIIAFSVLKQLAEWKYIVMPICALTNISYFLVSAKEIGLPIPDNWVNSANWIKRFLA